MELTFEEINPLYNAKKNYDENVDFNDTFEDVINSNTFSKDFSYFNDDSKNEIYNNGNISYDDILASLNVKVHNGALKFINNPTQNTSIYYPSTNNTCIKKQCAIKKVSFLQQTQTNNSFNNKINPNKNLNKDLFEQYYKDYSYPETSCGPYLDPYPEYNNENSQNVKKQMSLEEIKQKKLEQYINYHMEKRRIAQIKSKKLIIPGNENGNRIAISRPNYRLNKLFIF